jgi:hypothetical protein
LKLVRALKAHQLPTFKCCNSLLILSASAGDQ